MIIIPFEPPELFFLLKISKMRTTGLTFGNERRRKLSHAEEPGRQLILADAAEIRQMLIYKQMCF